MPDAVTSGQAIRWTLLAVLAAVLLTAGNARVTVYDRDEARFALAVREMRHHAEFVLPTNWGEPRYHKPILIYWAALAAGWLVGPGEFALRLPSALAGLATLLLTLAAARRWLGEAAGWRAAPILLTSLLFVLENKVCTADGLLLASTTLSFVAWGRLRAGEPRAPLWRFLFWVGVGFGLLAKVVNIFFLAAAAVALAWLESDWDARRNRWFLAILIAGAVLICVPGLGAIGPTVLAATALFFFVRSLRSPGGRAAWNRLGWWWGAPLALAMFAVWVVPALIRTQGEFFTEGVLRHLLGRSAEAFEGHWGTPLYYVPLTILMFLPWGGWLPAALGRAWTSARDDATTRFVLAWIIGPFAMLELTTSKLPHYMIVAFPALAMLTASALTARAEARAPFGPQWLRRFEAGYLIFVAVALAGGAATVSIFASGWSGVPLAVVFVGLIAAVGVTVWRRLAHGHVDIAVQGVFLGAFIAYGLAFAFLMPALEPLRIAPKLARLVEQHRRAGEPLIIHKFHHASVGYYVGPRHRPEVVHRKDWVAWRLQNPEEPALVAIPVGRNDPRLRALTEKYPRTKVEKVAEVSGYILPEVERHTVWLVRGAPKVLIDEEETSGPASHTHLLP